MSTPARLAAFALGLVAVFGAALGLGSVVGPVGPASAGHADAGHDMAATEPGGQADEGGSEHPEELPAGLQVSEDGYTLALDEPDLPAGSGVPLSFRIVGPDGSAVTDFDVRHDEDL